MDEKVTDFPRGTVSHANKAEHGSSVAQNFITMPPDTLKPFFWYLLGGIIFGALALTASAIAGTYMVTRTEDLHDIVEVLRDKASDSERSAELAKYYTIDMETYLYKQGLQPPPDPWRARKRKENKQ